MQDGMIVLRMPTERWEKKEQAIEWYKKALEIKPDQAFSIRKLEALTHDGQ